MKKLTAVFITLIFAYTGFSQGYFRIHAGPVFNYLDAEGDATFSNVHTGVTFGVGYEMVVAKNFSSLERNSSCAAHTQMYHLREVIEFLSQVPVNKFHQHRDSKSNLMKLEHGHNFFGCRNLKSHDAKHERFSY